MPLGQSSDVAQLHESENIKAGKDRRLVYFCTEGGNLFLTEVFVVDDIHDLDVESWPVGGAMVTLVGEDFMYSDMYGVTVMAYRGRHGLPVVFGKALGIGDRV